jgi:thiol:disulfide interchange protein
VNGPQNRKLLKKFEVFGYPSLVMFVHGKPIHYKKFPYKASNLKFGPVLRFIRKEIKKIDK